MLLTRSATRGRRRPRLLLLTCIGTALLGATGSWGFADRPAAGAAEVAETPVAASTFAGSVGVGVHMSYADTSYADADRVATELSALGISHVRDGVTPGNVAAEKGEQLLASRGVRFDYTVGAPASAGDASVSPALTAELAGPLAGTYDLLEAPNEYDCSGDANWPTTLRQYDANLRAALDGARVASGIPVLGPSFCRQGHDATFGSLGDGADLANAHPYAGGTAPELALRGGRDAALSTSGKSSVVFTEDGYHTAAADGSQPRVSERDQADYVVRTLLEASALGVTRNYLYELQDEMPDPSGSNQEEHFGLVRSDGSRKPAFTAVQDLLSDVGGNTASRAGQTAALPLTLLGGGALLHHLLLQRADGSYVLAMWLADPLEDLQTHAPTGLGTAQVRVQTGGAWTADARDPSGDNVDRSVGAGSTFDVPVGGAVTLLTLTAAPQLRVGGILASSLTGRSYASAESGDGAVVRTTLAPDAVNWTSAPLRDATAPAGSGPGSTVGAEGTTALVSVPNSPSVWSIEFWERTDASSANGSTFMQSEGLRGGQVRTYDVTDNPVAHAQISAYGLPPSSSTSAYGTEIFGQGLIGQWHHLTLVNDGTSVTLYVDGVVAGATGGAMAPLTGVYVGSVSSGYRGSLAGLGVYPFALSAAQVFAHATADSFVCPCPTAVLATDAGSHDAAPKTASSRLALLHGPTALVRGQAATLIFGGFRPGRQVVVTVDGTHGSWRARVRQDGTVRVRVDVPLGAKLGRTHARAQGATRNGTTGHSSAQTTVRRAVRLTPRSTRS